MLFPLALLPTRVIVKTMHRIMIEMRTREIEIIIPVPN